MSDRSDLHWKRMFALRDPNAKTMTLPRLYSVLLIAVISVAFSWMGIALARERGSLVQGLGAFLVVTGIQIACWLLGIRLEILGNTTEPSIDRHEKSTSEKPMGDERSGTAFAFDSVQRHLESAEEDLMHVSIQTNKEGTAQTNDLRLRLLELPHTHVAATVLQVSLIVEQALQKFGGAEEMMRQSKSVGTATGGSRTDFFLREGRREFIEAYSSFRDLRNSLVHNYTYEPENDERFHFRVIDFGMRLIHILDAGLFRPSMSESIDGLG